MHLGVYALYFKMGGCQLLLARIEEAQVAGLLERSLL
jgi:hypothetical protein